MTVRGPVLAWSYTRQALEQARQMRLIREAESLRHIGHAIARRKQPLCDPKPPLQVVSVRRHPGSPGERTREMKAVESCCGSEFRQRDVANRMLGQIFHCAPDRTLISEGPRGVNPRSRMAFEEAVESRQKQLFPFECRCPMAKGRMRTVELRRQNRVIYDQVEGMAVVVASSQGGNHRVRNGKHAVAPADVACRTDSMYFAGRYSDNAADTGYVRGALVTNFLRATIGDGDHQPVVVVAWKLVIPEFAVQDLEPRKLCGYPALWRTGHARCTS